MGRRNLLLCFDAFGTLFVPKRPIAEQYATVARQSGLDGLITEQVQASFKTAFSGASRAHPNYGRANNMGAEQWWTNVIHNTFQPLVGPSQVLPKDLAPRLLHRFSSSEGYTLLPGVGSLLRSLKQQQHHQQQQHGFFDRVAVGIITNSDDRVPSILSSLGLRVSPLRFGCHSPLPGPGPGPGISQPEQLFDIDLHCMSYDVGHAKPDRQIFDAAESLANQLLLAGQGQDMGDQGRAGAVDKETMRTTAPWLKIHVGDEYGKDILGARAAGWSAVLIGTSQDVPRGQGGIPSLDDMELGKTSLEEVFPEDGAPSTIRSESTQRLLDWLVKQ
ncbi:hypothetical protein N658DRAFT_456718, partial [Parathielavia hyrcaniae]